MGKLQERGLLDVKWIKGEDSETDIYTKNISSPDFNKHFHVDCGEYICTIDLILNITKN